jgi:hypothetical protein
MSLRHRRQIPLFSRSGADKHARNRLSDSADYWPLTIVPSASRPRRSASVWIVLSALAALGATVVVAHEHGIPAW